MSPVHGAGAAALRHEALLYRTDDEFLAGVVPYVRAGLDAGEPVLFAAPGPHVELTRAALGQAAAQVTFVDMSVAGRNPGRIIPGVLYPFVAAQAGPSRVVGEPIWPGRTATEYPSCVQHESLINRALADFDTTVLCPYDLTGLPAEAVDDAYRTHPVMVDVTRRWDSEGYLAPETAWSVFNRRPTEPDGEWIAIPFDAGSLAGLRRAVAEQGARAGLTLDRILDLQLAVNEVATNALEHGGGTGTLRMWTNADGLVCELSDAGGVIAELAGRIPPGHDGDRGRGLVLVNHVCDLVHIHTAPGQNTVRLHVRRAA